ncbi:uncharacterized protein METZ01_LOCUS278079, partial [marine metagenome]
VTDGLAWRPNWHALVPPVLPDVRALLHETSSEIVPKAMGMQI